MNDTATLLRDFARAFGLRGTVRAAGLTGWLDLSLNDRTYAIGLGNDAVVRIGLSQTCELPDGIEVVHAPVGSYARAKCGPEDGGPPPIPTGDDAFDHVYLVTPREELRESGIPAALKWLSPERRACLLAAAHYRPEIGRVDLSHKPLRLDWLHLTLRAPTPKRIGDLWLLLAEATRMAVHLECNPTASPEGRRF